MAKNPKLLRDITVQELNVIFHDVTVDAALKTLEAGRPVTGMVDGKPVKLHPDGTVTEL
jgi:hypothetical protein